MNKFCHDSGSSSGEDSGIQEDSDIEFPDWTELSSTLDISSMPNDDTSPEYQHSRSDQGARPQLPRCPNLDHTAFAMRPHDKNALVTSKSTIALEKQVTISSLNIEKTPYIKVSKTKPVTLATRVPVKTYGRSFSKKLQSGQTSCFSSNGNFMSCNSSSMINLSDALFSELNSSLESMENLGDINFCYDDPFLSMLD